MRESDFDPVQQEIRSLSRELVVVGVTGTKGKTTTTSLLAQLLNRAGVPAACTTTIDTRIPGDPPGATCSTLELLRDLLRRSRALGIRYVVVETTSYALAHGLADCCVYAGGVFTNLGREHLNLHGTAQAYLEAKRRLFTSLAPATTDAQRGWAVANADDPAAAALVADLAPGVAVANYGLPRRPGGVPRALHFYAVDVRQPPAGLAFTLCSPERLRLPVQTSLRGSFNLYNVLAASAAAYFLGLSPEQLQLGLAGCVAPPGRFEPVAGGPGRPQVVVDYAHTAESLEQALVAARRLVGRGGRLWVVFGCGGETDPGKRPLMGRVAAGNSDRVVITSDNPRGEDPAAIADQILAGCRGGAAAVQVELDRRAAIALAIRGARPVDVVLMAGKGHERQQVLAQGTIPFSDREVAQDLLSEV